MVEILELEKNLTHEEKDITFEEKTEDNGIVFSSDSQKGLTRVYENGLVVCKNSNGTIITNPKTLKRVKSLKIPPAWVDVWICVKSNGHLQVTGKDVKGRKQYIYHSKWTETKCETKFDKMQQFGIALPKIRKQVQKDIAVKKLSKQKMLATIVGLLDYTLIRIGNKSIEKKNHSYGLTTLRNKHLKAIGKDIVFEFAGKRTVKKSVKVTNSKLAKIVKQCKDIPGYHLFGFYDTEGVKHDLQSQDVNLYLKEISGKNISAKDFRTWGGSSHAIKLLQNYEVDDNEKILKKNMNDVVKSVASKLGNTVSVCKEHYLHPVILSAYKDKLIHKYIEKDSELPVQGNKLLMPEEKIFMKIINKIH